MLRNNRRHRGINIIRRLGVRNVVIITVAILLLLTSCSLFNSDKTTEVVDVIDSEDQQTVVTEESEPVVEPEPVVIPPSRLIVNADVLNVRSAIGTDSEVLGNVNQRTVLDILEEGKDSDGKVWYKVPFDDGEGWLAGWFCNKMIIEHILGTYKYDYPNDSVVLAEDHYIVFELINDKLIARYYGTSDDFDEAREGYQPGFFVLDMVDLRFEGKTFSFDLTPSEGDMLAEPVDLEHRTAEESLEEGNLTWAQNMEFETLSYEATYAEGIITITIDGGLRTYQLIEE